MKPTYGRVSELGAVALDWSVAHLGPIAATAEDAALVYAVISGPDPKDPNTLLQPAVQVTDFHGSLEGVRIGVYWKWFNDADADIVASCNGILQKLVGMGAELIEVAIPDLPLINYVNSPIEDLLEERHSQDHHGNRGLARFTHLAALKWDWKLLGNQDA